MSLFDKSIVVARPTTAYVPLVGGSWYEEQVYDFQPLVDPTDATKLLIVASGMKPPAATGEQSIGRFHAAVGTPHSWTSDGQILTKGASGAWDEGGVRTGSHFYDADS